MVYEEPPADTLLLLNYRDGTVGFGSYSGEGAFRGADDEPLIDYDKTHQTIVNNDAVIVWGFLPLPCPEYHHGLPGKGYQENMQEKKPG